MEKEKKEIGKLLELLNERIKEGWKPYGDDYYITKIDEIWKSDGLYFVSFVGEDYPGPVNLEHLLTKQAGLIKWLVDNDKIDRKKVNFWNSIIYCVYEYYPKISVEDELLMLLSISDTPIEDLISYLK